MNYQLTGALQDRANAIAREQRVSGGAEPDAEARFVFALSDYACSTAARHREWLHAARDRDAFAAAPERGEIRDAAAAALGGLRTGGADMPRLQQQLRTLRQRFQLWIVWRHLTGRATLEDTTAALSALADELIDQTLAVLHGWATAVDGAPCDRDGVPQQLVVLALGKLGAGELNLSSDVDLIFAYPEAGHCANGKTNQQFFVRLGQQLIQALDTVTADGFVFRVDMRLRPFGASGPLVMHFAAMEDYFVSQGRDWERYAFIKARPCAGDVAAGRRLLDGLRPFVYRRYLDFGALDALRDMKLRIYAERHDPDNLKLGPGGIRDVEFTIQVQQLVWGGRQPELQQPGLLPVLDALRELGHVDGATARDLADGYRFLRDAEHSLQAEADQQTQTLPALPLSRERLARAMGANDYPAFLEALNAHRDRIAAVFAAVIGEPETGDSAGLRLWLEPSDRAALSAAGFRDAEAASSGLADLVTARERSSVGSAGRDRLDRLMPRLLDRLCTLENPDLALQRVLPVLKAVMRRSAYLALLYENPATLGHFLDLALRSRWVAEALARHPAFFDALLDEHLLGGLPARTALRAELHERVTAAAAEGRERVLDVLREYKEHHVFNVALAEVRGTLPLMNASDYLTYLAEAVLEEALDLAWQENLERYPEYAGARPFVIVGYGKLGGIELAPGSDLDLVFVHDLPAEAGPFLHRLVRRLLHIITVPTYAGTLYEVDMRLRPSGNAGTMVSSLKSFRDYQQREAWVWEHQALVRARAVAGDPDLMRRFDEVRREALCRYRDPVALRDDVLKMRRRIAEHHDAAVDLKRGSGGIVDIEFMVQYLVLAHAHQYPDLAEYTDNIRILETAERLALIPAPMAHSLREAYLALRAEWHRSLLDLPDSERAAEVLQRHRSEVIRGWEELFGDAGRATDGSEL